jgi:hypothetical protein
MYSKETARELQKFTSELIKKQAAPAPLQKNED